MAMMRCRTFVLATTFVITSTATFFSAAETYFSDDFDDGLGASEDSVLSWEKPYSVDNPFGMMIGEGDIYTVSSEKSYNGRFSLRLNFDGRNGWCNMCGSDTYFVDDTVDGQTYLKSDSGDLLINQPDSRRKVFNKDDKWSQWTPIEVKNQALFFEGGAPSRNDLGGIGEFSAGQEIKVSRICGIDGDVGVDVMRRSDCNLAINYLEGVSSDQFKYGDTFSRRMYFYIPKETVLPSTALKLGYTWFEESGRKFTVLPLVSVHRGETLEIVTNGLTGSYTFPDVTIERDTWYYLEEVYQRESSPNYSDGKYSLYFYKASSAKSVPILTHDDVKYGDLQRIAIIGNWQHTNDAEGYIYIDAVAIEDGYIGPIENGGNVEDGVLGSPPNAPEVEVR